MSVARARRWLPALLLAQVALALLFAWQTPAWETPDEPWHLGYITWLKTERRLPPISAEMLETWVNQEASQPPLYYTLAALAGGAFDTSDMDTAFVENPGRWGGVGLEARNHNYALHGPWDAPLASPLLRGLFVARLVAGAMAVLAAWATFQLAATLAPRRGDVALAAAGILAFTPQLAFLSGAASNDTSAAALCTVALWRMAIFLRRPGDRNAAWLGLALGLALLTKSSALVLVPLAGLAALSPLLARREAWRSALRHATLAIGLAALIAGWWYTRNLLLYDTLYGRELHLAMPWAREVPASLADLVADDEPWILFLSYWAAFGWGTIRWPDPVYRMLLLVCAAGGIGLFVGLARRLQSSFDGEIDTDSAVSRVEGTGADGSEVQSADSRHSPTAGTGARLFNAVRQILGSPSLLGTALLALFALLVLVALVGWMQQVRAHWGRLLFPAAGAISVLLAFGLHCLLPRARLAPALALCLALWAAAAPWVAIRPALLPPPALSAAEVQALPNPVSWRIGDVAELIAVTPETVRTPVDAAWRVRLCWRALRRTERELQALVHLVGADDRLVASYHSVPADGNLSTRAWTPGMAFCETVDVLLEEDVPAPAVYDVAVGLFEAESQERMAATTANGESVGAGFVTRVKVEPAQAGWQQSHAASGMPEGVRIEELSPEPRLDVAATTGSFQELHDPPTVVSDSDRTAQRLRLAGFSLPDAPVCAGRSTQLALLWQAGAQAPTLDWQVLLHLRPWPSAPVAPLAQADGPVRSADGREYPTSLWSPEEHVADVRTIDLPTDLEPGRYAIITGLYRLPGLSKATVLDAPEGSAPNEIRLPTALEVIACDAP